MTGYYKMKHGFLNAVREIIERGKGKEIPLSTIELNIQKVYPFSRSSILKALEPYNELGIIKIKDNMVVILGRNPQE